MEDSKSIIGRWNYYFLRYFVGTVVGAVIVYFLVNNGIFSGHDLFNFDQLSFDLPKSIEGKDVTLFLVLGLAYCYIASAPGTVFHAARGLFWEENPKDTNLKPRPILWKTILKSAFVGFLAVAFIGWIFCHCLSHCEIIYVALPIVQLICWSLLLPFTRASKPA